jgi:tetratricopeptide (TPR) repeat protein
MGLLVGRAGRAQDPEPANPLEKAFEEADEAVRKNPESAAPYVARAKAWVELGSPEHALADLDQAVSVEPESEFPYLVRGSFLMEQGNLDRAIEDFSKACELAPTKPETWACRGKARSDNGRHRLALKDLNEALRLKPDDIGFLRNRARVQSACNEPELAIADLDEALRLEPDNAELLCARGNYRNEAGDTEGAIRDIDEAIRIDPQEVRYYANRALIWTKKKDFDRAQAACDLALRQFPESSCAFYSRSYLRYRMGQLDEALADVETAMRAAPKDVECYGLRAGILAAQKRYEEALNDLTLGLAINPRHIESLCYRAYVRSKYKQIELATEDLDEAVRVGPENSHAFEMRGRFRLDRSDRAEALEDFEQGLQWHPRSCSLLLLRVTVRIASNDIRGAQADLAKLEQLHPNEGRVYLARAQLKQRLRQYAAVMDELDLAVRLAPDDFDVRKARADEFLRQQRYIEAAGEYDVLLKVSDDKDAVLQQRASIYLLAGEYDQALRDVEALRQRQVTVDILILQAKILQFQGNLKMLHADLNRAIELVSAAQLNLKARQLRNTELDKSLPQGLKNAFSNSDDVDSPTEESPEIPADTLSGDDDAWESFVPNLHLVYTEKLAELHAWRGCLWESAGDYDQAINDLNRAIHLDMDSHLAWERRTWIEVTSGDASRRTKELNTTAIAVFQNAKPNVFPYAQRIKAAAYANSGDFEQAVVCQRSILEQATDAGVPQPILAQLQAELHLYESGQPYREQMAAAESINIRLVLGSKLGQEHAARFQYAASAEKPTAEPELTTKSYIVADLVAGPARLLRVTVAEDGDVEVADPAAADTKDALAALRETTMETELKSLQRLIESTVEPDSWEWSDGLGTIAVDVSERTLQIHQTDEVHAEIEQFLTTLRHKHSLRAVLKLRVATFRDVTLQPALALEEEPRDALFGIVRLTSDQVRRFHELVDASDQAAGMKELQIHLAHGQTAATRLRRRLLDRTTEELRELKVTWSVAAEIFSLKIFVPQARVLELSPGESLLVDLTDAQQSPGMKNKSKATTPSAERILLLISPQIVSEEASEPGAP